MPDNRSVDASGIPLDESENGKAGPDELQQRIQELEAKNANLHDQMLQANLYELQQRRENDSLREELSQLRERLSE